MNNNKIIALLAVVIIIFAGIGAVYMITKDSSTDGDTITDARGREVAVPDEIDSVLAIKSCSLQLVSYFDAVNKVTHLDINESFVGTDNRTHTFVLKDLLEGLPIVDPSDAEQVIMAGVDMIISSTIEVSDLNEEQRKYGVPVFAINADVEFGSDIYYGQILSLGKLFGEEERAKEVVNGVRSFIGNINDNTESIENMTAYACGMNFFRKNGFLMTSGDYLPFEYSKIENVFDTRSNKQPFETDIETVVSKNPNIIFIDGGGFDVSISFIKDNRKTLESVDAITNGEVYKTMVYKSWGTNWINQLINVYYVASIAHADTIEWDFEEKANNIIQLFYPGTDVTYADIAAAQSGGGCGKVTL